MPRYCLPAAQRHLPLTRCLWIPCHWLSRILRQRRAPAAPKTTLPSLLPMQMLHQPSIPPLPAHPLTLSPVQQFDAPATPTTNSIAPLLGLCGTSIMFVYHLLYLFLIFRGLFPTVNRHVPTWVCTFPTQSNAKYISFMTPIYL